MTPGPRRVANPVGRFKPPNYSERFRRLLVKRRRGEWQSAGVACVLEVLALDIARLAFLAGMREGFRWIPHYPGRVSIRQVRRQTERLWNGLP